MKVFLLLLLASAMHAAEPQVVFDEKLVPPAQGMPAEADAQWKTEGKNGKGKGPVDHGSLAERLGDSVESVTVHYFSKAWSDPKQVGAYLTGLLSDGETQTFTFPVWSQMLFEPEVECTLNFKNQKQGRLLLWGTAACMRDSNGRWWFVSVFDYYHARHPQGTRTLAKKTRSQP